LAVSVSAANWPAWRGPGGSGLTAEKQLPLHWSTNENVSWSVPLPDRGNSTPIVWRGRVFITQAVPTESRLTVMCLDRHTGKSLWQSGVTWKEKEPTNDENPPCTPSPVTDGKRVIAWFGSAGVVCYDFTGRELWRRDLGRQTHQWGYASSPVLYRGWCLLNFGPGDRSFVVALDKTTGRMMWKVEIPAVASADVSIGLPDRVSVAIVERQPIVIWRVGERRLLVDQGGLLFAELASSGALPSVDALPIVNDSRTTAASLGIGMRLDTVDLDAAFRLASLTPAQIGSGAAALTVAVTDENGFVVSSGPKGWEAIFGFYGVSLRTTALIPGQVQLLKTLLVGRESTVKTVILADDREGTYIPKATPKPSATPKP